MTKTVFIIGSGAREHAIIDTLLRTSSIRKILVYPGNDGMFIDNIVEKSTVGIEDIDAFITYCKAIDISMVIVGPEEPLVNGIVDKLKIANINCFGPSAYASKIEGCKVFSKKIMCDYDLLTAYYQVFNNYNDAFNYISKIHANNYMSSMNICDYVIKEPGLAGGKGVYLPETLDESITILKNLFNVKMLKEIIIENKLYGNEISLLGFCNGRNVFLMPQAQDYKKIGDNSQGPNTGGMGSYAPANLLSNNELEHLKTDMEKIVTKLNYVGVLYAGLMKTTKGIYFLEFNCRFGDPEAQVILTLLETDLYSIFDNCIKGNYVLLNWKPGYASNVILSHIDYPKSKSKELLEITFTDKLDKSINLYWGNVTKKDNNLYTNGGRVLSMVCYSSSLYNSLNILYNNIYKISYKDKYYRRDIGFDAVLTNPEKFTKIGMLCSCDNTSSINKYKIFHYLNNIIMKQQLNIKIELIISNKSESLIMDKEISSLYISQDNMDDYKGYQEKIVNVLRIYDIDMLFLIDYNSNINTILNGFTGDIFNIISTNNPIDANHELYVSSIYKVNIASDNNVILEKQRMLLNRSIIEKHSKIYEQDAQLISDCIKIVSNLPHNYKSSGVDIDKGNEFVNYIKSLSANTNKTIGGFCAYYLYKDAHLAAACDGVGTKLDLAILLNKYDTIGIDLVAMSVNDLYAGGAIPMFFLDYLAIDKFTNGVCEEIVKSIHNGCNTAQCSLIGGETAEMNGIYRMGKFDLAGFAVGVVKNKLPKKITKGNFIYGIKSNGVHSNGYTLIRKLLKYSNYDLFELLTPTRIYTEVVPFMTKYEKELMGMAHITGGGHIDNIMRLLEEDLTFELYRWDFPPVFSWIQNTSKMTYIEMMQTYNCGYGMVLIFDRKIDEPGLDYLGNIIEGTIPKFI